MTDLYIVSTDPDTGDVACSCGASAKRIDAKRFLRRHPSLCSERRRVAMDLANGTRCIDDTEGKPVGPKRGGRAGLVGR